MMTIEYLEAKTVDIREKIRDAQYWINQRMYSTAEVKLQDAEKMYVEIDELLGTNKDDRKIAAAYITPVQNGLGATRLMLEEVRSAR